MYKLLILMSGVSLALPFGIQTLQEDKVVEISPSSSFLYSNSYTKDGVTSFETTQVDKFETPGSKAKDDIFENIVISPLATLESCEADVTYSFITCLKMDYTLWPQSGAMPLVQVHKYQIKTSKTTNEISVLHSQAIRGLARGTCPVGCSSGFIDKNQLKTMSNTLNTYHTWTIPWSAARVQTGTGVYGQCGRAEIKMKKYEYIWSFTGTWVCQGYPF